jgi:hypothetical protein
MPGEQEELRLTVSLVDNASAGLAAMKSQVQQITGGSTMAQLESFKRSQAGMASQIKELTGVVMGGEKAMIGFIGKFGVAGAAIASAGALAGYGLSNLKEFADGVHNIAIKAQTLGIGGAELKSLRRQFEDAGLGAADADKAVGGLTQAVGELSHTGSAQFQELLTHAGRFKAEMAASVQAVLQQQSDTAKLTEIRRQAMNVYNNELQQALDETGNMSTAIARATEVQDRFLSAWHQDPTLKVVENLREVTKAEEERFNRQQAATKQYREDVNTLNREWKSFMDDMKVSWLSSEGVITKGLEKLIGLVKEYHETTAPKETYGFEREEALQNLRGAGTYAGGRGIEMRPGEGFYGSPGKILPRIEPENRVEPGPTPPMSTQPPVGLGYTPPRGEPTFAPFDRNITTPQGGSVWDRLLQYLNPISPAHAAEGTGFERPQLADRKLEDHQKEIEQNTDQLKRLNEYFVSLDVNRGEAPAGDGGAGRPTQGVPRPAGELKLPELPAVPPFRAPRQAAVETPPGGIRGGGDVNAAIRDTAGMAGMDPAHWKAIASIESDLQPGSNRYKATQYKELFQIGARGAGSEWAHTGEGDIYNAEDNARSAARLAQENAAGFKRAFGRDPTVGEIYMMHQQGLGFYTRGAETNIKGNLPPSLQRAGITDPTHAQFEQAWTAEIERRAAQFRTDEGAHDAAFGGPPAGSQQFIDPDAMRQTLERQRSDIEDRMMIDRPTPQQTVKVEGSGTLTADVRAPRDTKIGLAGAGIFKRIELNRQTAMSFASEGPPNPSYAPTLAEQPL